MLQATGITKSYRGVAVLRGVSFALRPGEVLGVAGHNGSGKSTLLSIVAQAVRADSGTLTCDGADVIGNRAFLRAQLGYVPQQNGLLGDLSVAETLRFWAGCYGVPRDTLFAPSSAAALLGLDALAKKKVRALSGGMQKRLSLAVAMLHQPRFLLLDEVLSALDRHHRKALAQWLAGHRARGGAVLYCSHQTEELRGFCDNVMLLQNGQVVLYDTAAALPTEDAVLDLILNEGPIPYTQS